MRTRGTGLMKDKFAKLFRAKHRTGTHIRVTNQSRDKSGGRTKKSKRITSASSVHVTWSHVVVG